MDYSIDKTEPRNKQAFYFYKVLSKELYLFYLSNTDY